MPAKKTANHIHNTILRYINSHDIATRYDNYFKGSSLFNFDCQFIHENLDPPGRILDLGCGTARHLLFLESLGFDTFGIDLSRHFLQISRKKLQAFGCNPNKLILADIMHLPLNKNAKFDGILIMFSVLGLIQGSENRASILRSLHPHLKQNGKVILHVHNYEYRHSSLLRRLKALTQRLGKYRLSEEGDKIVENYRSIQDLFIHTFRLDEIINLLTMNNFQIKKCVGLNSRRDGICSGDIRKNANGFLIAASSAQD